MKRVVVIAKGDVQRVGYRDEVERIARKLGLTGYVENLKPYNVKIVAEGDEDKLRQFIGLLKIQKYPIFVEELDVSWHDATGEFSYFEIKRGDWREELFERLDAAGRLLHRSVELGEKSVELGEKNLKLAERSVELTERSVELGEKNLKLVEKSVELGKMSVELAEKNLKLAERSVELGEKNVELGEKNVELAERSVELAEKNLKLIEKSVGLGEKSVIIGEEILRTMREESEKTRSEIKLLRSDLREYIEVSLKDIRNRIMEIEAALKRAGIM
ncbi:MAG: acylphosphatase [Thermoproteota archaeon]